MGGPILTCSSPEETKGAVQGWRELVVWVVRGLLDGSNHVPVVLVCGKWQEGSEMESAEHRV